MLILLSYMPNVKFLKSQISNNKRNDLILPSAIYIENTISKITVPGIHIWHMSVSHKAQIFFFFTALALV